MRSLARIGLPIAFALLLTACEGLKPPISVGQRESLAGQGLVLTLTNTSGGHLHDVIIRIVAPDETERTYRIDTLEPHESETVGWLRLDGWPIPPDASVSIEVADYLLPVQHRTRADSSP